MNDIRGVRPAWAEIDLDNLERNYNAIRNLIQEQVKIVAVVKSNGYGHGAVEISRALAQLGVEDFAVATVSEGVELRMAGVSARIMLLGATDESEAETIVRHGLIPMVHTMPLLRKLDEQGKEKQTRIKVHIRVDTGNGNLGIQPEFLPDYISSIKAMEWVELEGLFTQLYATYGTDKALIDTQIDCFRTAVSALKETGVAIPFIHAASSPAIVSLPETHYAMIRPGNILYGIPPEIDVASARRSADSPFKPVMQLKSRIMDIKKVSAGYGLAYSGSMPIPQTSTIGTIPLGYADGLQLVYLDNCDVLVRGKRAPVFGKVTMDYFTIDLKDIPEACVGDEVVIFGTQGNEEITVEEIALRSRVEKNNHAAVSKKRLSRAAVCLLSKRIPRVYLKADRIVAVVDYAGQTR